MYSHASSSRPPSPLRTIVTLIVVLNASFATSVHSDKGKWTEPDYWGGPDSSYAVHLALLRGDGAPDHSRVLYWFSSKPGHFYGQERGWSPGNDDCNLTAGTGF